MEKKWEKIWKSRPQNSVSDLSLESLIRLDGFDSEYANYTIQDWETLCLAISGSLELNNLDFVLEIGCGAGALIYQISKKNSSRFYGIDYSESLIEVAKMAIPEHSFIVADASSIPFPDSFFDKVIVHSVFQYFSNKKYAKKVVSEIARVSKLNAKIAILDIYDANKKKEHIEARGGLLKKPHHLFFKKAELIGLLMFYGLFAKILPNVKFKKEYARDSYTFNILAKNGKSLFL